MQSKIVLLFIGLFLFSSVDNCFAAPAAPYTYEAVKKLDSATKRIGLPELPPLGATKEQRLKLLVNHFRKIYDKAGYDLDKSIVQFMKDMENHPKEFLERLKGGDLGLTGAGITAGVVDVLSTTEIDGDKVYKYLSKEAVIAMEKFVAKKQKEAKIIKQEEEERERKRKQGELTEAAAQGEIEKVRQLIEEGLNVSGENVNGETALMLAADRGHIEIAKLLIEKGALIDAKNTEGNTALILAAGGGHVEIAKLLIEQGADINVRDKDGATPLRYAAANNRIEIAKILIEKGADINASDKDGNTPLRSAAANNRIEIAKILIEKGADINAKDNKGVTPLKRAIEKGHEEMAELLRSYGAKE